MKTALLLALVAFLAAQGFIRFAPIDAEARNAPPVMPAEGPGTWQEQSGVRVALDLPGTPAEVLGRVAEIAAATPRTRLLAGSVESGRVTYVTRTAFWGFPDFTTLAARPEGEGTRLEIHARMAIEGKDWGVNRARLEDWLPRLGAELPPDA